MDGSSRDSGRWDLKPVSYRHRDFLSTIDWRHFERVVADYFREQGYSVEQCGRGASGTAFDDGVDLRMQRGGERVVVQCKHQNAYKVPHHDVNQLIGIKVAEGATRAILVTSGEFTAAAIAGAKGHVELIDGVELRELLGDGLEALRIEQWAPDGASRGDGAAAGVVADLSVRFAKRRRRRKELEADELALIVGAGIVLVLLFTFLFPLVLARLL